MKAGRTSLRAARFLRRPAPPGFAFLLALGCSLSASPAVAQGLPLELGVGVARAGDPAADLSDDGCAADEVWTGEARGGLRFSRAVRLEATAGLHFESDVRCATPAPAPPTGPFSRTEVVSPEAGYPFLSTDARLGFEPSTPSGPVWLRAFGGYGRMWGKGIGYWLAGGGLVFGGGLQTLVELEWLWFDVPVEEVTRTFLDAVPVSETVTPREISHRTFRLKLGFRWRP
ncbi:MAG: hypothetical protein R3266_00215 [Gemmatimonadota bacterium]|nr:hypothetical protein [Gemmatimonadota bacterium]